MSELSEVLIHYVGGPLEGEDWQPSADVARTWVLGEIVPAPDGYNPTAGSYMVMDMATEIGGLVHVFAHWQPVPRENPGSGC